jgi:2-dehydropantoate 2-reductase
VNGALGDRDADPGRGVPAGPAAIPHAPFVIGQGEVGRRLAAALEAAGAEPRLVRRDAGWEAALDPADPAPRVASVREEDLAAAWARFEATLHGRLVLVQNGFLEGRIGAPGELANASRGLIWFTAKGAFFRELMPSLFFGPAADALAGVLARGGLASRLVTDPAEFRRELVLKGAWNAIVGLPLAVHGVDLATYRSAFAAELAALADESCRAASAEYGVSVDADEALARLAATTAELGWVRGGTRALPFRNGAIARFGRRHGVPTPVTDRLLRAAGCAPEAA